MPKSENQKLKLLYIMKILLEKTDDEHGITVPELLDELVKYEVYAERKSIYTDFEALRRFGLDIIKEKRDKSYIYYIGWQSSSCLLIQCRQLSSLQSERPGVLLKK